jgi:hypothetical protein
MPTNGLHEQGRLRSRPGLTPEGAAPVGLRVLGFDTGSVEGSAHIHCLERGVLPEGTAFYEEVLTFAGTPGIVRAATERRLERRKAWAWDALAATRGCDLVFADPDNGLESSLSLSPRPRPRSGRPRSCGPPRRWCRAPRSSGA